MFQNLLFVMAGGAIGAALRYTTGLLLSGIKVGVMPIGTFTVNLMGCLLLGILTGIGERYCGFPRHLFLMLSVGVCGAFTTFSTFTSEAVRATESGDILASALYVSLSVFLGLLLFWGGKHLVA